MVFYEVRMTHSAEKELGSLSKLLVPVIWQKIKALAGEPKPRQAKKLKGAEKAYRLRVRNYRVIYTVDDRERQVTITAIRQRKDAYRQ